MDRTLSFINKAKEVHGDRYDYSKVEYRNAVTKVCIICPEHGEFWQTPSNHVNGAGCPECKKEKLRKIKKMSNEEFINIARKVHGDKYDYSKTKYVDSREKVCIICPIHGEFWQEANTHLQGHGCPQCSNNKHFNTEEFINKAREIHGDKYDYSKVKYVNNKTKICIICPEHGEFFQTPKNHLKGQGCPKCKYQNQKENLLLTTEKFIIKAQEIHGDRYDYSKAVYVNNMTPLCIICKKHGEFWQTPHEHLSGCGCQKCGITQSNGEEEIYHYLEGLTDCQIIRHDRELIAPYELDLYIPDIKLAIEFDGIIYHSEKFNKDKNYHLYKTTKCEEKGIRLIHIFEDEWNDKKELVKSMLRNIICKENRKIFARKCHIKVVDSGIARDFLDNNHIQGKCYCPISYGLYYNDELVSLMVFGKTRQQAKYNERYNETYEILRFCSLQDVNVIGGASRLLKRFITDYKPYEIITYADKRWSIGNLYEKIGFIHTHDSRPNYYYVVGKKRETRFKYRKSELIKKGFDTNKSEHQIMLERKIYRIYDCGTKAYSLKPRYL